MGSPLAAHTMTFWPFFLNVYDVDVCSSHAHELVYLGGNVSQEPIDLFNAHVLMYFKQIARCNSVYICGHVL